MRKLNKEELQRRIDATGMKPAPWAVKNGLNDESVRMWLKGGRIAKVGSIKKLADALGCNIEDISYWEHTVDFDSISQADAEINELRAYWGYLTDEQRQNFLMLIRTIAEPNMNSVNLSENGDKNER